VPSPGQPIHFFILRRLLALWHVICLIPDDIDSKKEREMLRLVHKVRGYSLLARDGEIGSCEDFLFDDEAWVIRYMVADTHRWLPGQKVLIATAFLDSPDWEAEMIPVKLTREQIKSSPPLDVDAPVSRRYEQAYHEHFALPYYWLQGDLWEGHPDPAGVVKAVSEPESVDVEGSEESTRMRSVEELRGYRIDATDDEFGEVEDFLIDDEIWRIDCVVVATHRWLPGGKLLLLAPEHVESIDWEKRILQVGMEAEQIKEAPEFDPNLPLNSQRENVLYDFQGRPRGHSG